MSASTGFHPDQARRKVGEKRQHLRPFQLLLQAHLSPLIDAMHLEHIFCQVEPYCSNVHIGRLFSFVDGKNPTLALLMPFRKGATIPLKRYEVSNQVNLT